MQLRFRYLYVLIFLSTLTVSFLITGCKKEKSPDPENFMKFDGQTYALENGVLEFYGITVANGYNYDLFLYTKGLTFIPNGGLSGQGSMLYAEVYSEEIGTITAGTYDLLGTEAPFTFKSPQIVQDLDTDDKTGIISFFSQGTTGISKSAEGYIFDINWTTSTGKKLTVHFTGNPLIIDMTGK